MQRLSKKVEAPKVIPKEFLDKHKDILDAVKGALNFIEPNYNNDE
jgi:hypothetical protein